MKKIMSIARIVNVPRLFLWGFTFLILHAGHGQIQIGEDILGDPNSFSGHSVSFNAAGTTVAIGSAFFDLDRGKVKVYNNIAGVWTQIGADLIGEEREDSFGTSISMNALGDIVAIGAPMDYDDVDKPGYVRVYQNIAGIWTQIGADIDGEAIDDISGSSISLNAAGDIVAIGAPLNDGNGSDSGHVRVYQNNAGVWTQIGADIDGEAASDFFGTSVSLNAVGDIIAIGGTDNDGNGNDSGHVRVYQNNAGVWIQIGSDIDGEATGDNSGRSVSLNDLGDIVAIGAPENDGNGNDSGHVRVYQNNANVWTQLGEDIDGEAGGDISGSSISLNATGDILAIGAPDNDVQSGQVRVYKNNANVWTQLGVDIDGNQNFDKLGTSVCLNAEGSVLAVGAPRALSSSGLTKVFSYQQLTNSIPSTNNNQVARDANIVMTFNFPITLLASNTIVTGSQTGKIDGAFSNNGASTVTFNPTKEFKPGEQITVQLTTGTGLVNPYQFSFWVQPASNPMSPTTVARKHTVAAISVDDIVTGDLDGDGDQDIVTCGFGGLYWYQNDGAVVPDLTQRITLYGSLVNSVVLGDADNDGDLDIFFTRSTTNIYFIENKGLDGFEAAIVINPGGSLPSLQPISLGDLDGNGFIDIIVGGSTGTLTWYKNNGNNMFGSAINIATGLGEIVNIEVGDMDNDGDLDLVSTDGITPGRIQWYRNDVGVFTESIEVAINLFDLTSISLGDINGDGDLDILVGYDGITDGKALIYFSNTGGGVFGSSTIGNIGTLYVKSVSFGDMDGDGDQDIFLAATSISGSGGTGWFRNDGGNPSDWIYIGVDSFILDTDESAYIAMADLDGDGTLEVTIINSDPSPSELYWYKLNPPAFVSATPSVNSNMALVDADIEITFTKAVTLTASNTIVTGSQTGKINGVFSNNGTSTVTINPEKNFKPGELVTVQLTSGVGLASPYSFSFRVQPTSNPMSPTTTIRKHTIATISVFDMLSGDLDGDGDQDLVVTNESGMYWYQNDGAVIPNFTAQTLWSGGFPWGFALGDADNDGDLDVFFTRNTTNIYFIENKGLDGFGDPIVINPGNLTPSIERILLGDFDGDGYIDVLVSAPASVGGTAFWYKNNRDHTFGTSPIIVADDLGSHSLYLGSGDIDNDGDLDIIINNSSARRVLWYPNNDGVFGAGILITSFTTPYSLFSIGDVDNDGDLDVVAGNSANSDGININIFTQNSAGFITSGSTIYSVNYGESNGFSSTKFKDLDGDGDLDVVWVKFDRNLSVSLNNGGSWTHIPIEELNIPIEDASFLEATADLDDDGTLEMFVYSTNSSTLSWYKLNPPTFVSATPSVNSNIALVDADIEITFTKAVTLTDSNTIVTGSQTGKINGVFSNNGTSTVTINPDTNFKPGELVTVQLTSGVGLVSPYSFSFRIQPTSNPITPTTVTQKNMISLEAKIIDVASGDLDNDGDIDLVTVSHATNNLIWYQNDGSIQPTFTPQTLFNSSEEKKFISVILGDSDNDGDLDIFFVGESNAKVYFIENLSSGSFGTATEIDTGTGLEFTTVFLGDLDGDGLIDVLTSSKGDNTLRWYKNKSSNSFEFETAITINLTGAFSVKVGDMDSDGDLDVIGAGFLDNEIRWYRNDNGVFTNSIQVGAVTPGVHSISVGDIDGDGDLDIASANLEEDSIVWYENGGAGVSFTGRVVYQDNTIADRAVNVDLKDLDGDGDLDILWAADARPIADGTIGWSRNDGGSPISWIYLPVDATAHRGYSVDAADLNGDGTLEFLGASLEGETLSWYQFETAELSLKAYLSGPFDISTNMMKDDLRVAGIIPTTSPYGDGATCNPSVFSVTGNNAIVDWVLVELRDKDNISTVRVAKGALLQRDGDVVSSDGVTKLSFVGNDSYYVSVSHRNHINIASDQAVNFVTPSIVLDLTKANEVRGDTNGVHELATNVHGLIPGDLDENNSVQTTDYTNLTIAIGQGGYLQVDTNLNGQIQSTDISLLLSFLGKGIQF